jgi:hypothetical protein
MLRVATRSETPRGSMSEPSRSTTTRHPCGFREQQRSMCPSHEPCNTSMPNFGLSGPVQFQRRNGDPLSFG